MVRRSKQILKVYDGDKEGSAGRWITKEHKLPFAKGAPKIFRATNSGENWSFSMWVLLPKTRSCWNFREAESADPLSSAESESWLQIDRHSFSAMFFCMGKQEILDQIAELKGCCAYEEKRAARLGFPNVYAYFEHKLEKKAFEANFESANLEHFQIEKKIESP